LCCLGPGVTLPSPTGRASDLAGADGAELELVTGEGEGARAVAVARLLGELGEHVHPGLEDAPALAAAGAAVDDLVHHVLELLAQDRKSTRLNSSHVQISYAVF